MIARSIGVLGFGFVADALLLTEVRPPPADDAAPARDPGALGPAAVVAVLPGLGQHLLVARGVAT